MRRRGAWLGLALAAGLPGCGSDGAGDCPAFGSCGGNVVGHWEIQRSCAQGRAPQCPGATSDLSGVKLEGTISFNADMTFKARIRRSGKLSVRTPAACLPSTCSQAQDQLRMIEQYSEASCQSTTGACSCALTQNVVEEVDGSYKVDGGRLTLSTDEEQPDEFCVSGDELVARNKVLSGGLAGLGSDLLMAGETVTTVFRRASAAATFAADGGARPGGGGGGGGTASMPCAFSGCGGEITGSWRMAASCFKKDFPILPTECPAARADLSGIGAQGEVAFNADGTYSWTETSTGSYTLSLPAVCLRGATCAALQQAFTDSTRSTACMAAADGCTCRITPLGMGVTDIGTYRTSGALVTLTSRSDGSQTLHQYCREGAGLKLTTPVQSIAGDILYIGLYTLAPRR